MLVNGCQNTFPHEEIKKYGCFYLSLVAWVEKAFNMDFSNEKIIAMLDALKDKGWIKSKCNIAHPAMVFNYISGKPKYFLDNSIQKEIPYTIRFPVFYNGNPTHFALGTHDGNGGVKIAFDPWAPTAEERGMKITHFRSFR